MNWTWAEMRDSDCSILPDGIQVLSLKQQIRTLHN